MATFGEFLAAERQQESGGNYHVVNSIGALGAYQIMTANLPSWSKAALGHSVSVSEFLSHPAEQDAIATYELKPKWTKFGPAGAAAWWYSGQTNPNKTYGNPPVYKYVQQVLARIGKAGSVSGGSGSGGSDTSASPADDVSGSGVTQAGLQAAGYEAVIDLTPWGIPANPFKLPGWEAGKLGDLAKDLAGGGASGVLGSASGMWDTVGPVILGALGVAAGVGAILIGMYVTARPAVDHAEQQAAALAPLAA
jgi:hypothetical protein